MDEIPERLTTSLLEFLVAGLLAATSMIALFGSLFPSETEAFARNTGEVAEGVPAIAAALLTVAAIALALGIVFEYVSRLPFEPLLDRTKDRRLPKFLRQLDAVLETNGSQIGSAMRRSLASHGELRFFIMHHSPLLYGEVDLQLVRMRLSRVLVLSELVWGVAALWTFARDPQGSVALITIIILASTLVTIRAVLTQFDRYCRAIERSCLVIFLTIGAEKDQRS